MTRAERTQLLKDALASRIVILDGAMGTRSSSTDFKSGLLCTRQRPPSDLKGANDLLVLTQPALIEQIHLDFLRAGAEIVETNTFNANAVSMEDYDLVHLSRELNVEAARLARRAADTVEAETGRTRWVAGTLGPTNRTASLSPDVEDPGHRNIDFDTLVVA